MSSGFELLGHLRRNAGFQEDRLTRLGAVEVPTWPRYRLLRVKPTVTKVDEKLQLRLYLAIAAHASQDEAWSAILKRDRRNKRTGRASARLQCAGLAVLEMKGGAAILKREASLGHRNAGPKSKNKLWMSDTAIPLRSRTAK